MLNKKELFNELDKGNVVILPSDTVYGLFADSLNVNAILKVDSIKNSNKPHLILVSNYEMLNKCVNSMSKLHKKIINKYWPGPLTILFEKSDLIPNELTKNSNLVGIRMPDNKMLLDIINEYNKPLLSTSANNSGENVIVKIEDLSDNIRSRVSYIYDGGVLNNEASTIIKIDSNKIIFLREGSLTNKIKEDFKDY